MAQQTYNQNRGGGYQGGGGYQRGNDQTQGQQQKDDFSLEADKDDFENKKIQKKTLEGWVKTKIDADTVKFADKFGDFIAAGGKGMTNSQIRNIFGEMRRIQMNGFSQKEKIAFILLKPKMAYAVKRFKENKKLEAFFDFFSIVYDVVAEEKEEKNSQKYFENLMHLMEAVLAYHKYHGGKE